MKNYNVAEENCLISHFFNFPTLNLDAFKFENVNIFKL